MDKVAHRDLAAGRWAEMSFALQMGNIGSEVSRTLKWQKTGKEARFRAAFGRALELFDLTINTINPQDVGKMRETCRAREEFCSLVLGGEIKSTASQVQRYYDQFALLGRGKVGRIEV